MKKHLDNLLFLFPVMFYYALEAIIVGTFITIAWKLVLTNLWGHFGYLQIVVTYWIIKMLLFNVFNLIAGLSSAGNNMEEQNKEFEENEVH